MGNPVQLPTIQVPLEASRDVAASYKINRI